MKTQKNPLKKSAKSRRQNETPPCCTFYQQGDATLAERYQIMQAQRERTLQEMEEMKRRLAVLNKKLEH